VKVYSGEQLPTYQVSGQELRIHWDAKEVPAPSMDDEPRMQWEQEEALCRVADGRGALIQLIIAAVYDTGAELAAINNGGDDYAAYQAFRVQAKALADGWLASK
jgi:hypothetical protein